MPLILSSQRLIRPNPLAYPAGATPGFDPSHIASRGNIQVSAVFQNGNFRDVTDGRSGTITTGAGSFTPAMDGGVGPSMNPSSGTTNTNIIQFPRSVGNKGATNFAFIARMATGTLPYSARVLGTFDLAANSFSDLVISTATTTLAYSDNSNDFNLFDFVNNQGHPVFVAVSVFNTALNWIVRDLATGQSYTGSLSGVAAIAADLSAAVSIGNIASNLNRAATGTKIAAVLLSETIPSILSIQQLQQFAADPWSFWYPNRAIQYVIPTAAAAATIQFGWEPQLPLLPHQFRERRGAIARGDDGSEATKINWFNGGWETQPPPPPHQPREKRGAILPRDDGNELPKINWFNAGWETQPPPPPHPKVESRGAIMPRDDGNQLPKINWFNGGWEVQPPPPATANRRNARAAILRGDDGTEGVYSSVVILTSSWGFDPNLPLVLRPKRLDASLIGDPGNQSPFILFQPSGFEIAPFQPPHPRSERSGSLMRGDEGAQAGQINFFPTGFEAVWHQPNHPRPERSGVMALGDIGYYAPTATVVTSNWGFDAQLWQPPRQIYRAATLPWGDDGIQSTFILFRPTGFEISPVQPPHPRFEQRAAGFLRGDDGNQDILRSWFNAGWEVAPYQPQHVAYAKAGAIMFGDDGTESVYVFIAPAVGTSTWRTLMGVGI